MTSSARTAIFAGIASITAALATLPSIVHACPMCFAGGNENQDAFLYGSLFLMIVPSATLGGLGYWVYRRLKAIDEGVVPLDFDDAGEELPPQQPQSSGKAVVLQLPPTRNPSC